MERGRGESTEEELRKGGRKRWRDGERGGRKEGGRDEKTEKYNFDPLIHQLYKHVQCYQSWCGVISLYACIFRK